MKLGYFLMVLGIVAVLEGLFQVLLSASINDLYGMAIGVTRAILWGCLAIYGRRRIIRAKSKIKAANDHGIHTG